MTARTSLSHPLYVSDLAAGPGRLGLTFCPGKKGDSVFGAPWDRDLTLDLAAIRAWGAHVILTLVEQHELKMLGVEGLGEAVRELGMEWHHFPIPDLRAPQDLDRSGWREISTRLHTVLDQGGRVLVHCRGGLGRAGTMAALLLIEAGDTAEEAMRRVRAARPRAIETRSQEEFLVRRAAVRREHRADQSQPKAQQGGEEGATTSGGASTAGVHSSSVKQVDQSRTGSAPSVHRAGDQRKAAANWFERLTGFSEEGYAATKARLRVENGRLHSDASPRTAAVGQLDLVSLAELRERTRDIKPSGHLRLGIVQGNVRSMHLEPRNEGALFQVASQFNLLEMVGPNVTPEEGVARYEWDGTQGPACAIAAGAGTIYRNYFAPVAEQEGQTATRQLDGLKDLGDALAERLDVKSGELWRMENGYAFPTRDSLSRIGAHLRQHSETGLDALRGLLRLGLHSDVEVTDGDRIPGPLVSQIYCSALPIGYSDLGSKLWTELAILVQEAAYEATLLAGVLNAARGASKRVLLTRIGGGVFQNDDRWISAAILRALRRVKNYDLEVEMVSYGAPSREVQGVLDVWNNEVHHGV